MKGVIYLFMDVPKGSKEQESRADLIPYQKDAGQRDYQYLADDDLWSPAAGC